MSWRTLALTQRRSSACCRAKILALPVTPHNFYLLGCYWQGQYFVYCCFLMDWSISCTYFAMFSTFLEWEVRKEAQVLPMIHYLDDFLFLGPKGTSVCSALLHTVEEPVFVLHCCIQFQHPIRWLEDWREREVVSNMAFFGLLPIVVTKEIWGDWLSGKRFKFHCDNLGVVECQQSDDHVLAEG